MAEQDVYYQTRRVIQYPVLPITIHAATKAASSDSIIDSGADFSLFNQEVAEKLEIQIETGKPIQLTGIGGKITAYFHEVEIQLFDKKVKCKVLFSKQFKWHTNLLGRNGFFETHEITFREKEKKIHVKEVY